MLSSRNIEGRRDVARGDRPPLREAVGLVLGDHIFGVDDVVSRLGSRGWLPRSRNALLARKYIGEVLSAGTKTGHFENLGSRGRGSAVYRRLIATKGGPSRSGPKKETIMETKHSFVATRSAKGQSVAEIADAAKKAGISLSLSYIYDIRSVEKKRADSKRKPAKPATPKSAKRVGRRAETTQDPLAKLLAVASVVGFRNALVAIEGALNAALRS